MEKEKVEVAEIVPQEQMPVEAVEDNKNGQAQALVGMLSPEIAERMKKVTDDLKETTSGFINEVFNLGVAHGSQATIAQILEYEELVIKTKDGNKVYKLQKGDKQEQENNDK